MRSHIIQFKENKVRINQIFQNIHFFFLIKTSTLFLEFFSIMKNGLLKMFYSMLTFREIFFFHEAKTNLKKDVFLLPKKIISNQVIEKEKNNISVVNFLHKLSYRENLDMFYVSEHLLFR